MQNPTNELKIGDAVTGNNLNGKPIAGKIVAIPGTGAEVREIAHVKTDDKAQAIHFARLSDLGVVTEPAASAA